MNSYNKRLFDLSFDVLIWMEKTGGVLDKEGRPKTDATEETILSSYHLLRAILHKAIWLQVSAESIEVLKASVVSSHYICSTTYAGSAAMEIPPLKHWGFSYNEEENILEVSNET